jgi:Ring hydroxylating alpha subunit (catalytic domain)
MRYEVYRNKNSSEEDFQRIDQLYKRVMAEDKYLCDLTQKNLNSGVFVTGELHPKMEKGPLYFQQVVREIAQAHHERERAAKQQIWPARQQLPSTALVSGKDIEFCSGLACQPNQEGLAW